MILRTIYKYELKKLYLSKVNLIALVGSVIMLLFLAITLITEDMPVSREAAKELDGRAIDAQLVKEMKPALRYEGGTTIVEITADYEKYVPVVDVVLSITGNESDLSQLQGTDIYDIREQKIAQYMDKQGLTEVERAFWHEQEAKIQKPFIYHYHSGPATLLRSFQALGFFILLLSAIGLSGVYARETAENMNQLLLCTRFGKKELFWIKFAAGITWILTVAVVVVITILVPFCAVYGTEGTGEMLQLVKPLSMLPLTIGQMLAIYAGIYLLAAVLFASVAMLLSVTTQNALAVTCSLMGYLLFDLFAEFPDRFRLLQKVWALRPNAVLMNSGFSNYRLLRIAGRLFLNYQMAPFLYVVIILGALLAGRRKYRGLQVGK